MTDELMSSKEFKDLLKIKGVRGYGFGAPMVVNLYIDQDFRAFDAPTQVLGHKVELVMQGPIRAL